MDNTPEIRLGESTLKVVPQRIGRLEPAIVKVVTSIGEGFDGAESNLDFLTVIRTGGYDLLRAFYPNMQPKHRFYGYETAAQMEAGERPEEDNFSPTFPEIKTAFIEAFKINNFDLAKYLGKVVDLEVMRDLMTARLAQSAIRDTSPDVEGSATTLETSERSFSPPTPPTA